MTENLYPTPITASATRPTSRLVSILAWIILLFPAGWGIYLTAVRAIRRLK